MSMHAEPKIGDVVQFTRPVHVLQGKAEAKGRKTVTRPMNKDICLVVNIVNSNVKEHNARWVEMLWNDQIIHASSYAYEDSFHTIIPATS